VAGETPQAAGPAAAAVLTLAAGLAELTAALAGEGELIERGRALGAEAEALGRLDAAAYAELLRERTDAARDQTVDVPLRIAELAAAVADLAADAAERGKPDSRYDAIAGSILAASAASVAAMLVRANLREREDPRAASAKAAAERASLAADRARA
jgi:hypothetical protein